MPPNKVSFAVNTTFRGGFPTCRPGFKKVALNFNGDSAVQSNFQTKRFQGADCYQKDDGTGFVMAAIGGRLFRVAIQARNSVQDVSASDLNPPNRPQAWLQQVENFLVVQDGQSKPLIFNGSDSRRATMDEVPTGTRMAYGMGRLVVSNGREYLAGDIVGGPSGTAAHGFRDAALKFTENTYLNEGGAFAVPIQSGEITGMKFTAQLNTGLGQGELVISTSNGMFTNTFPTDRDQWKNLSIPLQTVAQVSNGSKSHDSLVNVNGDLWYRASDGIRSLAMAVRYFQTSLYGPGWSNVPLSREVTRILSRDDPSLLGYASAVNFDHRLLTTCSPYQTPQGVAHRGLAVLDFDIISSMSSQSSPAWEGLWTGLNTLKIIKGEFSGVERTFIFCLSSDNLIELWELTLADKYDNTTFPVEWWFEGASHSFGDNQNLKSLQTGTLFLDQVNGNISVDVKYRPDQNPCWIDWHSWTDCNKNTTCDSDFTGTCATPKNYHAKYVPKVRLPQPADDTDPVVGKPYRHGYEFQTRIAITGSARVKRFQLHAWDVQEDPNGGCP